MKILNIILKVILSLLLVPSVLGIFGVFPAPTADMYKTPEAFAFIQMLMDIGYINIIMSIVFIVSLVCLWIGRTALATLLLLPITVNIVAFHAFLDGGLFTMGALMGNVFLVLNLYFMWLNRDHLKGLLMRS